MTGTCRGCGGYRCNCPDPVFVGVIPFHHQVDPSVEQQRAGSRDPHVAGRFAQTGAIQNHNEGITR